MSAWAVVVAAGRGARFGSPGNKVYAHVCGRGVLSWALAALTGDGCLDGIAIVHAAGEEAQAKETAASIELPLLFVPGGATRQESVLRGLRAVPEGTDLVAIHDGARPLLRPGLLRQCLEHARDRGSGVAASPVRDTIKRAEGDVARETLDRDALRAMKTPQCFRLRELLSCYEEVARRGLSATDDAQVMELCERQVFLVPCGEENIKITTPEDIRIAEALLGGGRPPRVGFGYDVHALAEGRALILCGVRIPHERGLQGHSDADVATHALIDALLGACAMGDIGMHFPDSDERYRGADSLELLRAALDAMAKRGFSPSQVDITIVAQRPRLAAHREAMRENIARAMRLDIRQIGVKFTTTEGLGLTGRQEGIAAQAVASVVEICSGHGNQE